MKLVTRQSLKVTFLALVITVMTVLLSACSQEFAAPTASQNASSLSGELHYPELTPEMLAAGPKPGYRFVQIPDGALDYGGDTVATSRVCRSDRDENVSIGHMLELRIYAGCLQQNNTLVTVIAPLGTHVAVADFYPHPYQFTSTVRIKWKLSEMGFPAGTDFSTFVPFYVDSYGNYVEMPHEWEHGYDNLLVYTDHFSRYIIGQRVLL